MARDAEKEKFWREKMAEYEKGDLTVREFCARDGLREVQFYYWRRALKAGGKRKQEGFVELLSPGGGKGAAGVSVRIGERMSIELERGFDAETLKAALRAVGVVGGE
jgi:hypothetical protein